MILKLINISAATLINNMDQSVDPCDDFHKFACGNFIKNTNLDDKEHSRNSFTVVSDTIFHQMRMIISDPIQSEELRPFKMTKLLFKSCMDQGIIILQIYHISKIIQSYYNIFYFWEYFL